MFHTRLSVRGFTLLELMVVIAIISILASFTAPTLTRQITKAKLIEAQNIATQQQSLVEEFILLNGRFPTQSQLDGISQPLNTGSVVKEITINNANATAGDIKLSLDDSISNTEGPHLTYSRDENRNWQCTSNLAANVLPEQCDSATAGTQG